MRSFFKHFGLMLLALLPVVSSAALQNGKVQVGVVKGKASLLDPQAKKQVLSSGQVFQEGYKVETDANSSAELILSNGSTLLVSPGTLLELRTFRQVASDLIVEGSYQKLDKEPSPSVTEIEVKRGKVIGEVRKLNPMSSYVIKTPVGVARIRGTLYVLLCDDRRMDVSCVHGSVEVVVSNNDSGPIMVRPGTTLQAYVGPPVQPDPITKTPSLPPLDPGAPPLRDTEPAVLAPLNNPTTLPGFEDTAGRSQTIILDTDITSDQLKGLAQVIQQFTSLAPEISQVVLGQASLAPATTQPKVLTGSSTSEPAGPDGTPKTTASPTPTPSGTTGGSSTVSDTIQKITDTATKTVEQQQTVDPSATGG